VAPKREIAFLTLDVRQRDISEELGFAPGGIETEV
jgi:hypothetical protein